MNEGILASDKQNKYIWEESWHGELFQIIKNENFCWAVLSYQTNDTKHKQQSHTKDSF